MSIVKFAPTFFCGSQQDVIDNVHDLAEEIKSGEFGEVNVVIVVIEGKDGSLSHTTIGGRIDLARVIGLLTIEAVRSSIGSDE